MELLRQAVMLHADGQVEEGLELCYSLLEQEDLPDVVVAEIEHTLGMMYIAAEDLRAALRIVTGINIEACDSILRSKVLVNKGALKCAWGDSDSGLAFFRMVLPNEHATSSLLQHNIAVARQLARDKRKFNEESPQTIFKLFFVFSIPLVPQKKMSLRPHRPPEHPTEVRQQRSEAKPSPPAPVLTGSTCGILLEAEIEDTSRDDFVFVLDARSTSSKIREPPRFVDHLCLKFEKKGSRTIVLASGLATFEKYAKSCSRSKLCSLSQEVVRFIFLIHDKNLHFGQHDLAKSLFVHQLTERLLVLPIFEDYAAPREIELRQDLMDFAEVLCDVASSRPFGWERVEVVDAGLLLKNGPLILATLENLFPEGSECFSSQDFLIPYLAELRRGREPLGIGVTRERLLEELPLLYSVKADYQEILRPLNPRFLGETGVEGGLGGLSAELLGVFVEKFCRAFKEDDLTAVITDETAFAFGAVICKILVDGKSFFFDLPAVYLKVIVDGDRGLDLMVESEMWKTLRELDPEKHNGLKKFSEMENPETCCVYDSKECLVVAETLDSYILEQILDYLVHSRKRVLRQCHRGFCHYAQCFSKSIAKRVLRSDVVLPLICGKNDIRGADIVQCLEVRGWDSTDSTPYHLCCWLHSTTDCNRRLFLRLCTSTTSIPREGLPQRIKIFKTADSFSAQSCFYQLSFPVFSSYEECSESLAIALATLADDPQMHDNVVE